MQFVGQYFLYLVWGWLIGWGGLSLLVAAGAGAVWWFIPAIFTKVRALAFNVAVGALAFNFVYTMGLQHGASATKAAWDAAVQQSIDRGGDAREQAESEIPPVAGDPPPPAACELAEPAAPPAASPPAARKPAPRRLFPNDRFDRDNR
jgi:hypothetical protein